MFIKENRKQIHLRYRYNKCLIEAKFLYYLFILPKKISKRKQKWLEKFLTEFIQMMEMVDVSDEKKQKLTYRKLEYILYLSKKVENGEKYYLRIKSDFEKVAMEKMRNKDKLIVGFMANYSSSWIGDALYHLFEQSERFEPYIFLFANYNGQNKKMVKKEYISHLRFFSQKGFRVVETYDINKEKSKKWKEIEVTPDIFIWLTSWQNLFKRRFRIEHYFINTLHTYIPYGFMVADDSDHNFVYHQYDHAIHSLVWKNFEESIPSVNMAQQYNFIKGINAVFTGYPKMDEFYSDTGKIDNPWKSVIKKSGNYAAKRIIYAPHHTVDDGDLVYFSTFAYNYNAILELARKYDKETVWIFKPHPHLKYKAIKYGIFRNEKEWEEYEEKWKNLQNADVVIDGSYYDLFLHSDGMILDSVSFLAEYLYVHKPLLLLRGEGQRFNDFGKELVRIHYSADGKDVSSIENFISDVVLKQNDVNSEIREAFFRDNLDYRNVLGKSAAENIFYEISHGLEKLSENEGEKNE